MLKSILAGVGVIAIVGVSAATLYANHYADDSPPPALAVNVAGLDLTSDAGIDLLDQRINRAINAICRFDGTPSLHQKRLERTCRDNAWAGTRPQVAVAIDTARRRMGMTSNGAAGDGPDRGHVSGRASWQAAGPGLTGQRAPIGRALWRAFQSGESAAWRDGWRRGLVLVSDSRHFGSAECRNVSVVRDTRDGWETLQEGMVCRGSDGQLHDAPRPYAAT